MNQINPKIYNLSSRLNIQKNKKGDLFFIIDRKSRIIMKDGLKIIEYFKKIKEIETKSRFYLKTTAPICSKTKNYLIQHKIFIIEF